MSKKTKMKPYKLDKANVKFEFRHTQVDPSAAHSCTYRFPLEDAQGFEKRAIAMGTTRGQLLMSLVRSFNASTPEPKGVKLAATAEPTIYGTEAREKAGISLKRSPAGKSAKKGLKKAKAAPKAKKAKVAVTKPVKAAKAKSGVSALGAVLGKLTKKAA